MVEVRESSVEKSLSIVCEVAITSHSLNKRLSATKSLFFALFPWLFELRFTNETAVGHNSEIHQTIRRTNWFLA